MHVSTGAQGDQRHWLSLEQELQISYESPYRQESKLGNYTLQDIFVLMVQIMYF